MQLQSVQSKWQPTNGQRPLAPAMVAAGPASAAEPADGFTPSTGTAPASASVGAEKPAPTPPALAKWTILHYSAADNNLHAYLYDDIALMEKVGTDAQTNLVVQIDQGHRGQGAERIYVTRDEQSGRVQGRQRSQRLELGASLSLDGEETVGPNGKIDSPVVERLGPVNMSDPATLADFVRWGIQKYPAEHYALVIADHGDAWKGAVEDESHKDWMGLPQMKQALMQAQQDTGRKLDVIGFDACLMANAEVAYQLKDCADYLVASQETEGHDGWPYNTLLTPGTLESVKQMNLFKFEATPRDLATGVVHKTSQDQNSIPTLSAIDLSKMDGVAQAVVGLREAVVDTDTSLSTLKVLRRGAQSFSGYRDLYDFAQKLSTDSRITDERLKEKARGVMEAVDQAVIAEQHAPRYANAHGLTVELRTITGGAQYMATDFQQATDWNAATQKIGG